MFVPSITPAAEPALNRVRQRVSVFSSQAEPLLVEGCPAPHGGDPPVRDRFSWAVMSTQHVDVFASAVEATSHPVSLIVLTFPADSNTQAVRPASLHRWIGRTLPPGDVCVFCGSTVTHARPSGQRMLERGGHRPCDAGADLQVQGAPVDIDR